MMTMMMMHDDENDCNQSIKAGERPIWLIPPIPALRLMCQ